MQDTKMAGVDRCVGFPHEEGDFVFLLTGERGGIKNKCGGVKGRLGWSLLLTASR
jgi:hypothetical protein